MFTELLHLNFRAGVQEDEIRISIATVCQEFWKAERWEGGGRAAREYKALLEVPM